MAAAGSIQKVQTGEQNDREKTNGRGKWDVVPGYLVDGVVPPEMNSFSNRSRSRSKSRQKNGCFYMPDILPKHVFFIPLTVDSTVDVKNLLFPMANKL